MELELPPLNMNTKQFSLYGTTLKSFTVLDKLNVHAIADESEQFTGFSATLE